MSNGIFFVSWELWQQMTFVLAMAIVAVFCAGLVKLWWTNRLLKKQEILDEEKRARLQEMRRSGLSVKRANDIPFGVRAIQSGVEVDGIWISRPPSSNDTASGKPAYSTTFVVLEEKEGVYFSNDSKTVPISTMNDERAPSRHSPFNGSISQRLNGAYTAGSTRSTAPPVSKFAVPPQRQISQETGVLNEDTLRRLDGQAHPKPVYETYMPTSAPRNPRQPSQRSSASSSGDSMDSQPRSTRSASGKSYTSSHSSRLYMPRNPKENRIAYNIKENRGPFDTPTRTPSGFSALSQTNTPASFHQNRELPVPEPTFGPGDFHLNRSARKVNDGFEVLPAGTFGTISVSELERARDLDGQAARPLNKLRNKSVGQFEHEEVAYGQPH
ncbi:hypothetical protein B0H63DRAFT_51194 [Podospora didyma]|uniref:Uncharacterized protein n=1 Tax=Podospora didyma TaxID=330526 RepID=A0AAE0U8P3_9PEZI|nr:hypothetical protein B0H63DRAFT_51194 [Podospora didyma]